MSSSVLIDNKAKDISILGKEQTRLNHTLAEETPYSINFTRPGINFCLGLHYDGSNSLFINATKIYPFKAKDSEIKKHPLCLGNISKDFTDNNMKKQDQIDMSTSFLLIILLILVILLIFINN